MSSSTLQTLISYVEQEYYRPTERCCQQISECITEMHGGDDDQTASLYKSLSRKLAERVKSYIQMQRLFLKPYSSGEAPGTYCDEHCTNSIKVAAEDIQTLLVQLRAVVAPLPHEVLHPDWDRTIRRGIKKLDAYLTEMFHLQSTSLASEIENAESQPSGEAFWLK